jgi:hypothetical protein
VSEVRLEPVPTLRYVKEGRTGTHSAFTVQAVTTPVVNSTAASLLEKPWAGLLRKHVNPRELTVAKDGYAQPV